MKVPFVQDATFTGLVSTLNNGTSEDWYNAYTTSQSSSSTLTNIQDLTSSFATLSTGYISRGGFEIFEVNSQPGAYPTVNNVEGIFLAKTQNTIDSSIGIETYDEDFNRISFAILGTRAGDGFLQGNSETFRIETVGGSFANLQCKNIVDVDGNVYSLQGLPVINELSGNWDTAYLFAVSLSSDLISLTGASLVFQENSATYVTFPYTSNFLFITGGSLSGSLTVLNNLSVFGNTTILGSALLIDTNTVTLSVQNFNIYNNLSAAGVVYVSGGNSDTWNLVSTVVQSNSGSWDLSNTTNYLSTNNILVSSLNIFDTINTPNVQTNQISVSTRPVFADQLYYTTDNVISQLSALSGNYDEGQFLGNIKLSQNTIKLVNIGNTWVSRSENRNWIAIAMSSDGKYQTSLDGDDGLIYVSNTYGQTWVAKGLTQPWRDIAMSSDGKYQISVAFNGFIYVSTDYGNTWLPRATARTWEGIAISSDGRYQTAVASSDLIYISRDYGNTWFSRDTLRDWQKIAMSSDGKYQTAIVDNGQIYVSFDYGDTWIFKESGSSWRGIAMSSDGKYQTTSINNGNIFISTDYGNTWLPKNPSGLWRSVAMSSDGRYQVAVQNNEKIYISENYGNTWSSKTNNNTWVDIAISSDGKYITAIAAGDKIYTSFTDEIINGNLLVTQSISANNLIYGSTGNSNIWDSTSTRVISNSGNWNSVYTATQQGSSVWYNASGAAINYSHLNFIPLTGGTIDGNLSIEGNLFIAGTATYINVEDFQVQDPLIYIGVQNLDDILDLGIVGVYRIAGDTAEHRHTGLIRNHFDKKWVLFSGLSACPLSGVGPNPELDNPSVVIDTLRANIEGDLTTNTTIYGNLTATEVVFAQGGNSNSWNTAYNISTTYQNTSGQFALSAHSTTHHTGGIDAIAPNNISAAWAQVQDTQQITGDTVLTASRNSRVNIGSASFITANITLPFSNNQVGDVITLVGVTFSPSFSSTYTVRFASVLDSFGVPTQYTNLATISALGQSFTFLSDGTDTGWSLLNVDTHPASRITGLGTAALMASSFFAPSNLYQNLTGNWQSTYITVSALSASWEESAEILPTVTNYLSTNNVLISSLKITDSAVFQTVSAIALSGIFYGDGSNLLGSSLTTRIRILTGSETNLDASQFGTYVKEITGPNIFTYTNFTSGRSVILYLSANHLSFSRHYFPQTTYISPAGSANTVFTFDNYVTKVTIQNTGREYIGTTELILTDIQQVAPISPEGPSILLDGELGYLKTEDDSYVLL